MLIWSIIITGYVLLAARLIWAIQITHRTIAIPNTKLTESILKASELMLDQQVLAVQADNPNVGFQLKKTLTPNNETVLEAVIPFLGRTESLEFLVHRCMKEYTIQHCESLEKIDGVIIIDVTKAEKFDQFIKLFHKLFSVPNTAKYSLSKSYLLDARKDLRAKIVRFTEQHHSSEVKDICEMFCPSSADLFQSVNPPSIYANDIYLLTIKEATNASSHN